MSRYRKIDLCMHADEKYRRLSPCQPCGQALWWHLIAGEQTGIIPGLFRIGEAAFAEQLNWPIEGFRKAFREVFEEGMAKADWEARLVWIPKALKYNPPGNPNIVLSWRDSWHELPECHLKVEAGKRLKDFMEGYSKAFQEALDECFAKPGTGTREGTREGVSHKKNGFKRKEMTIEEISERVAKGQQK